MVRGVIPTEREAEIIKLVVNTVLQDLKNPQTRSKSGQPFEDHQAPETYIALPPEGGIPALSRLGTASDQGPQAGDGPGSASCDIYTLDTNKNLQRVGTSVQTVYNLSTIDIEQDWVLVNRTKFGFWVASESSTNIFKEGILDANLTAATNAITSPSTAGLSVYGPPTTGTGGWEAQDEGITVTNRLTAIATILAGTWVGVIWTNGEWRPVFADCDVTVVV